MLIINMIQKYFIFNYLHIYIFKKKNIFFIYKQNILYIFATVFKY